MASSDEEGEILPDAVEDYYIVDCTEEPISFAILPVVWNEDESLDGTIPSIFLRGTTDGGLQKIHKEIVAWKLELSYVRPEIWVLSKGKVWIKLQSPRKSFENIIRTILITVHWLHFVKKNPETSGDALWNHLLKSFSSYMVGPTEKDLVDHLPFIKRVANMDKDISKSKLLASFLAEMEIPGKREDVLKKSSFIVDTVDGVGGDDDVDADDDDNEPEALFDSVCAFCDDGGDVLPCEGRCIRSFHPTKDSGADTDCESLGFADDSEYEAFQTFLCDNCKHEQHQCFICGLLGSSNRSSGAEVFPCASATCGHFYHPKCVAYKLHPFDETQAEELLSQIAAGESFSCPAHKCNACKKGEDKECHELQFAVCRRCPKAYHRKCLPGKILFEPCGLLPQRAWDDLLPKRILIFCLDHKMIPGLGTPSRDHILFPYAHRNDKQKNSRMLASADRVMSEKRNYFDYPKHRTTMMQKVVERQHIPAKSKPTMLRNQSICMDYKNQSTISKIKASSSYMDKSKSSVFLRLKPAVETSTAVDAEMRKRIRKLMTDATASFNEEAFKEDQRRKCRRRNYSQSKGLDKAVTTGKIEAAVKAVRAALQKLDQGGSIDDAKAFCEPDVLFQLSRWKMKLEVYLAPFLHGMRYTSYGRHFTKENKLKEIVNRLHWYVEDGDTIVDFCCGSNDFSRFMKEKLDKMGKRCYFKNYDILPPKNDFNFEKRDWFTVPIESLPEGSRLIMGLNPPFGVQAVLANKFIDHALKFRPKLLILIVPSETKRLDTKVPPYDLIWEDREILCGKAFYLPGSLDIHNQQLEDWNNNAPPLYLWSRPDWTVKHKAIARGHSHSPMVQDDTRDGILYNNRIEENQDCHADVSNFKSSSGYVTESLDCVPEVGGDTRAERRTAAFLDGQKRQLPASVSESIKINLNRKQGLCKNDTAAFLDNQKWDSLTDVDGMTEINLDGSKELCKNDKDAFFDKQKCDSPAIVDDRTQIDPNGRHELCKNDRLDDSHASFIDTQAEQTKAAFLDRQKSDSPVGVVERMRINLSGKQGSPATAHLNSHTDSQSHAEVRSSACLEPQTPAEMVVDRKMAAQCPLNSTNLFSSAGAKPSANTDTLSSHTGLDSVFRPDYARLHATVPYSKDLTYNQTGDNTVPAPCSWLQDPSFSYLQLPSRALGQAYFPVEACMQPPVSSYVQTYFPSGGSMKLPGTMPEPRPSIWSSGTSYGLNAYPMEMDISPPGTTPEPRSSYYPNAAYQSEASLWSSGFSLGQNPYSAEADVSPPGVPPRSGSTYGQPGFSYPK